MSTIAISVALAAALCFALTSALQHWAASREPAHKAMDPRLLLRLVRRPVWLAGELAHVTGTGLQAVALGLGALAVVEPVLAGALFLAIPVQAVLTRQRPRRQDVTAVTLASAGLAIFLLVANPSSGIPTPPGSAWAQTAVVLVPLIACCFVLAHRWTGTRRATCLGLASGAMNGVAAALLKACADQVAASPVSLLADWHPYALVVVGLAALVVNQNAFQGCSLAAPLTALTLTEPVVSLAIGVTAFREDLSAGGLHALVLTVAVMAMVRAVWLASSTQPTPPGDLHHPAPVPVPMAMSMPAPSANSSARSEHGRASAVLPEQRHIHPAHSSVGVI